MDIYKISKLDLFAILATKSDIDDARIALTSEGKPFDQDTDLPGACLSKADWSILI